MLEKKEIKWLKSEPLAETVGIWFAADIDDLIKCYFRIGFNDKEILGVLAQNQNIVISNRTLKRQCR